MFMRKLIFILTFVWFAGFTASAQMQISGTVTNAETGDPIPGVSVVVQSQTTIGTTTDMEGAYSLEVPSDAETLVFTFVGMQRVEEDINDRSVINIQMQPSVEEMEEVVVTAIGMRREAKKLGYTVSEVSGEDLERSGSQDAFSSLKGKVAGVQISQSSGTAGASNYIEIRGAASITGNNSPLYVVDGVPINNTGGDAGVDGVVTSNRAMDLEPSDIESISILKGGAATALYGMRGANGVIVIETKKGQQSDVAYTHVDVNSWVRVNKVSQLPARQKEYVQGHNYPFLQESGLLPEGAVTHADNGFYAAMSWGPHKDDVVYTTDSDFVPGDAPTNQSLANIFGGWNPGGSTSMDEWIDKWGANGRMITREDAEALGISTNGPVNMFDAYDYFKTGVSWKTHASVTSGDDNSSYYLSASTNQNTSVIPNDSWDKSSFRLTASQQLADNVTLEGSLNLTDTKGVRIQRGSNTSGVMLGLLRTPPTFDNSYGYEFADGTQRTFQGGSGYDNPYWTSNKILYQDHNTRAISYGELSWDINDWMSLTYRLGFDYWSEFVHYHFAKNSNASSDGYKEKWNRYNRELNSDLILNISRDLTSDLGIDFTGGHHAYERWYETATAQANGLIEPEFYDVSNTTAQDADEYTLKLRRGGIFGDLTFSYQDMLFLGGTGRFDWSTTMPQDQNPFFYPSVNLGFVFTELPFMDNISDFLSFGKLRASYAVTASDAGVYNTVTTFSSGEIWSGWTQYTSFPFLGYTGYDRSFEIGNQDLKPEQQVTQEVGLDLRFFDGALRLDVAYFQNRNEDLLMGVPIAPSSGFSSAFLNAGTMETTGIEVLLNVTPVQTQDFTWDFSVNFANPKTMVKELAPGVDNIFLGGFVSAQSRAVAGEAYRSIYTTEFLTDDQGRMVIQDDPSRADQYYGAPIWDDEMKSVGKVAPEYTGGLTNTFSYKGLTLSGTLEVKSGGLMWNGTKGAMYFFGVHGEQVDRGQTKVWEGVKGHLNDQGEIVHFDGNDNEVAGPGETNDIEWTDDQNWYHSGYGSGFTGPSAPFIEETDWVRLREVTLSYSLPQSILANSFFRKAEVYFTGNNLWLDTPYTGIDPETNLNGSDSNSRGLDYFNMPGTKSYTFGLRVGF